MALIAMAVLAPAPVSAHAGHFGSDYPDPCDANLTSQCIADDGSHYIYDYGLSGDQISAGMTWTKALYTPSNSHVSIIPDTCGVATAFCDVLLNDGNYGLNGAWAWTACDIGATHGGNPATHRAWCYPQWLKFNLSYKTNYSTLTKTRAIACHEMGHSLGLRHNSLTDTCMHNPPTSPQIPTTQTHPSGFVPPGHDTDLLRGYY